MPSRPRIWRQQMRPPDKQTIAEDIKESSCDILSTSCRIAIMYEICHTIALSSKEAFAIAITVGGHHLIAKDTDWMKRTKQHLMHEMKKKKESPYQEKIDQILR